MRRVAFILFLLLIPTQLGKYFWPDWSYLQGIRLDYLSPAIYLTDIFPIFFGIDLLKDWVQKKQTSKMFILTAGGLLLLVGLNVYLSLSPTLSIYRFIKVLEIIVVIKWISVFVSDKWGVIISRLLGLGVVFEVVLSILQLIFQSSVGGLLYWFGERSFSVGSIGIARALINGQEILRPYGTFSHPNVLGGYFFVFGLLILLLTKNKWRRLSVINKLEDISYYVVSIVATFLTISRSAIVAVGIGIFGILSGELFWGKKRGRIFTGLIVGLFIIFGLVTFFSDTVFSRFNSLKDIDKQTVAIRREMNDQSQKYFLTKPLYGYGLGVSPIVMSTIDNPSYYKTAFFQPVHNLVWMALLEGGLLLAIPLFYFISKLLYRLVAARNCLLVVLGGILFISLFDHYFVTSQQGIMMTGLVLGLAFNNKFQKIFKF